MTTTSVPLPGLHGHPFTDPLDVGPALIEHANLVIDKSPGQPPEFTLTLDVLLDDGKRGRYTQALPMGEAQRWLHAAGAE